MKFLTIFCLSIMCGIGGFIAPEGWQTVLLWVTAVVLWIVSGVLAEKVIWKLEDHETRINKLEKRVDKLEGKNKK